MATQTLKLVLLPGMDGTGELFSSFLSHLSETNYAVVSLPENGAQDYKTLTEYVKSQLPEDDFIILAESFSGPIASLLAKECYPKMKSVIFIATFISPPNKFLLGIAKLLPLKQLSKFPLAKSFHKLLFLGSEATNEILFQFQNVVDSIPSGTLAARIESMKSFTFNSKAIEIPCLYIQATSDKLVPKTKYLEFKKYFNNIKIVQINGPHFIMQAKPVECAREVRQYVAI